MLPIVKAPDEVLSQVAKAVTKIDSGVLRLTEEMKDTLAKTRDPEGVGLAAPQVGRSVQIFIMKPSEKAPVTVCINPAIEPLTGGKDERAPDPIHFVQGKSAGGLALRSEATKGKEPLTGPDASKKQTKLEGCLSLHNVWGEVTRKKHITISYLDEKGKSHIKTFKGFSATIVQHEMDHLEGILFPKRVLEQKGMLYKLRRNEKGEDIFEEIEI